METQKSEIIYDALRAYENGSRTRELVLEIKSGKKTEPEESPDKSVSGIISEHLLLNKSEDLKKVVAAARKIAKASGDAEVEEKNAYEFAATADDTIERIKQTLLYQKGEIEYEELANKLIDAAESRLLVFADHAVDAAVGAIPQIIKSVPYLQPVAHITEVVLNHMKPAIKKVVKNGVRKVAEMAKKAVPKIIKSAKEFVRTIKTKNSQLLIN